MGAKKRKPGTSVKERLFEEYYKFSFFKAVDLLESIHPEKKPVGKTLDPHEEVVRFSVKPGFTFPASDIEHLSHDDEQGPVNMNVTFMGLIGANGVLPRWYNELAVERNKYKDYALTEFLDIFHHRLLSLFYMAWKKHRFPENYQPGAKDRLSNYLLSFTGLGTPGLSGRIGIPDESLSYFSGFLANAVPSASTIEAAVEYYAGARVRVDQFLDRMFPLEPEDQTQLGIRNIALGKDTICGDHVRENQTTFRINIGPMSYDDYLRFLPTGDLLNPTYSFVRYMVGIEYEFEIRIILDSEKIAPMVLGGEETPASPRLGWSSWLKTPGVKLEKKPSLTFKEADMNLAGKN